MALAVNPTDVDALNGKALTFALSEKMRKHFCFSRKLSHLILTTHVCKVPWLLSYESNHRKRYCWLGSKMIIIEDDNYNVLGSLIFNCWNQFLINSSKTRSNHFSNSSSPFQ